MTKRQLTTLGIVFSTLIACSSYAGSDTPASSDAVAIPAKVTFSRCAPPRYPKESIAAEETGVVTLKFLISEEGQPIRAEIFKSSGHPRLDQTALDALSKCTFTPATANGRAVESTTTVQYVWKIDNQKPPPPSQQYTLKDEAVTGTNIKRPSFFSTLPLDKRYAELTPEQKLQVKSQYEPMGEDDEPPFPIDGLGPLYKAVSAGHKKILEVGQLSVEVHIDSAGNATSVSVFSSPDPEMTKFAAGVAMLTKYKPAICGGSPCAMGFPIRIDLQVRY